MPSLNVAKYDEDGQDWSPQSMSSGSDWESEYTPGSGRRGPRVKRRRVGGREASLVAPSASAASSFTSLESLSELLAHTDPAEEQAGRNGSFEALIEEVLPNLLDAELAYQDRLSETDESGQLVHPISRTEAGALIERLEASRHSGAALTSAAAVVARRLKEHQGTLRRRVLDAPIIRVPAGPLTPLEAPRPTSNVNPQVLDALYAIQTTPFERSFLSRLNGVRSERTPGLIALDWETRSPWMELMGDIREHYGLAHPEREQPVEIPGPIEYASLQPSHLPQVHSLLAHIFWEGIDVSDALHYSPERCTIVATYKRLVVGVALLSSPVETYITYLAVRPGWENAQIATSMLYHLITLNPNRDITLHVSISNPAMLLYNRFGFKAEEFIVGFYEDYLDSQSRASKNAFRLRLRR
ncbi:hypothetical protein OBBRIDRAFT_787413 [Obba rivulosa]|uniref:N-acetyltransferase domain-containing protein n=1 Tax=Obba rivulosa TaxID=1052685 RepID=A0A8E2DVC2_9APHY|nr:hypothetical protein OBBRIDRAFT_787413 [Obba rivulosa]